MFAEIPGQPDQSDVGRILVFEAVHHLPGIIPGAVVHKNDLIIFQFSQDLFAHVFIEKLQRIRIVIYGNHN